MVSANAALIVVYLIVAMGLKPLSIPLSLAAPVWVLSGVALAAVMVFGYRLLPGVFLGTTAACLWLSHRMVGALPMAAVIGLGSTTAAAVSALLLLRNAGRRPFDSLIYLIKFILFGAMVGAAVSATIGVLGLTGGRLTSLSDYPLVWLVWWLGAFGGILLTTPALLTKSAQAMPGSLPWRRIEQIFAFLVLLIVNILLFRHSAEFFGRLLSLHLELLVIPLLLYIAVRFDLFGASLAVTITAAVSTYFTLQGYGPLLMPTALETMILTVIYLTIAAVLTLGTAMVSTAAIVK